MAQELIESPRARLFVALDLPEAIRAGIAEWQRSAVTDEALRPVAAEALHVTLVFLGWRPQEDVERLGELATAVDRAAPELRMLPEPVAVPRKLSRTSLFAIEAESPGAIELQAGVEARLAAAGMHDPEKRGFWPHVTVARVRKRMHPRTAPGPLPDALLQPFRAVRVSLYRSLLRPSGAEYVSMANVELPIPGSGKAT